MAAVYPTVSWRPADDAVDAILEPLRESSDVLADDHSGFFDGPLVRQVKGWDELNARQPASRFLPELPTGTNLAHFSHQSDDAAALCVACLLKSRAIDAAFARGGLGPSLSRNLLATISGTEPRYVVFESKSLLDTILLNVTVNDSTRPSWVCIHRRKDGQPGPIARMGWRPRLLMPVPSSESQLPCAGCSSSARPRFTQAVMVDTYNFAASPFGSKSDLEKWKATGSDPQLLPFAKNVLSLGINSEEWSLRALARLLSGQAGELQETSLVRSASAGESVSIRVISSNGNQAKIDDAPANALRIPGSQLACLFAERSATGAVLLSVFEKEHREAREQLIPGQVTQLLNSLANSSNPASAVQNWISSAPSRKKQTHCSITDGGRTLDSQSDTLTDTAHRIVRKLNALPQAELLALRPVGRGGNADRAARQSAFETIWHRLSLPGSAKRHAMREALATVAGIFALYPEYYRFQCERLAFQNLLSIQFRQQRSRSDSGNRVNSLERLLRQLIHASPLARDTLLLQLVAGTNANRRRVIDFADLLIDVALWNDPQDPTPARWSECLADVAITSRV